MAYYFMTETQTEEYNAIRNNVIKSGAGKIAHDNCITKLGHNPFSRNYTAHERHVIKKEFAIANAPITDYLAHIPSPMAKLKNDILAESCRYFDSIGETVGYVKQITLVDCTNIFTSGSWKVFKTEEGWMYQNRASNKTVHKVEVA